LEREQNPQSLSERISRKKNAFGRKESSKGEGEFGALKKEKNSPKRKKKG